MLYLWPSKIVCIASAIVVSAALAGCGQTGPVATLEETVPVEGTITYKGQPLEFYSVMLLAEGHRPAAGVTDPGGKFVLGTNRENDGAVAGKNGVAVVYVGPPQNDPNEGINDFTPPPPPKVKLPAKFQKVETSGVTVDVPSGGTRELKIELE